MHSHQWCVLTEQTFLEIYNFGKKVETIYDAIAKAINLRYSLPYIYSDAWTVTNNHSTMMRALVMDFNDKNVVNMNNEYMFGRVNTGSTGC